MSLYRKYRPQNFSQIIGQEHVTTTLQNELRGGSITHAYLFCGPRGSGKTTIARIFAKSANCQNRKDAEPCGKCASCQAYAAGNAIDLIEIDAASNRGIDDIRELREGARFAPQLGTYKVYIIDECHQLSKDAANALLKTLEEPPSHAMFILATTEANKMIPTIVSRCQRFDFKKLQTQEIIEKLKYIAKQEKVALDDKAAQLIAMAGRGSFRDAESLLETCINFTGKDAKVTLEEAKQVLGAVDIAQIASFVEALIASDAKVAVTQLNEMADASVDLQEFARTLVFYLHQLLLATMGSSSGATLSAEELQTLQQQATKLPTPRAARLLEAFAEAETKMKYANISQLPLELAVLEALGTSGS